MSLKFIVLLAIVNSTLGVSMHVFDGYPSRYSESELAVFDKFNYTDESVWNCQNDDRYCEDLEKNHSQIVIWGDSHATSVASGFIYKKNSLLRFFGEAGCPPLADAIRTDLREFKTCPKHNDKAINYISASSTPLNIIISARWSYYLAEENISIKNMPLTMDSISRALEIFSTRFPQHTFHIIGQMPESRNNLLEVHRNNIFGTKSVSVFEDTSAKIQFSANLSSYENVEIIDPKSLICDTYKKCNVYLLDGNLSLFDKDHPTKFYASSILEQMSIANF